MSSQLIYQMALPSATGATAVLDFNWRSVNSDAVIIIRSTKDCTFELQDGLGGDDPLQATYVAVPYVASGSSVPVYDGTKTSYTVVGNTAKKIIITRAEVGDWLRATITPTASGAGTISIDGTIS